MIDMPGQMDGSEFDENTEIEGDPADDILPVNDDESGIDPDPDVDKVLAKLDAEDNAPRNAPRRGRPPKNKAVEKDNRYLGCKFYPAAMVSDKDAETYAMESRGPEHIICDASKTKGKTSISEFMQIIVRRQAGNQHFSVAVERSNKNLVSLNLNSSASTPVPRTSLDMDRSVTVKTGLSLKEAETLAARLEKCLSSKNGLVRFLGLMEESRDAVLKKYPHLVPSTSDLFKEVSEVKGGAPQATPEMVEAARRVTTLNEEQIAAIRSAIHPSLLRVR